MTIWTTRNERIEGYFYTIDQTTGNCIFQCIKQTTENNSKLIKRRFKFADIIFMAQQKEDNQIATFIDQKHSKQHHACRNRRFTQDIMIDSEVSSANSSRKVIQQLVTNPKPPEISKKLEKYEIPTSLLQNGNTLNLQGLEEDLLQEEQQHDEEDELETDQLLERAFSHSEIRHTITDFDLNRHTTFMDFSRESAESIKNAEQLEREIMHSTSDNIHLLDERNDPSVHLVTDDQALYSSVSRSIKIIDKAEINKEFQDDFSTKANSTLDSMRPDSAKSEQSVQMGGNNLKSKGKKLRLTKKAFEPQVSHPAQNERFQINKLANKTGTFNLEERFLEKLKAKKDHSSSEYAEEKLISQDCSWRSFLCDQKKDHILLFNNLMVKSGHTSSGSSIGSHLSNSFRQGHKINPNKLNSYFNQAAIAMSINIQQSLNSSFNMGPQPSNLNLSSNNLNNSFSNLPASNVNSNNNNNVTQVLSSSNNFSSILTGSTISNSTQQTPQLFHFDSFQAPTNNPNTHLPILKASTNYSKAGQKKQNCQTYSKK